MESAADAFSLNLFSSWIQILFVRNQTWTRKGVAFTHTAVITSNWPSVFTPSPFFLTPDSLLLLLLSILFHESWQLIVWLTIELSDSRSSRTPSSLLSCSCWTRQDSITRRDPILLKLFDQWQQWWVHDSSWKQRTRRWNEQKRSETDVRAKVLTIFHAFTFETLLENQDWPDTQWKCMHSWNEKKGGGPFFVLQQFFVLTAGQSVVKQANA